MNTNTKRLLLAFGIALTGWIALFYVFRYFVDGHLASEIAGLSFIALQPLYESFEKIHARRTVSTARHAAVTVEQFSIPWYLMAVYGALIIFGVVSALAFLPCQLYSAFG